MRAPVSVIIPTLNAASSLPACLSALFEGVEAGIIREVIVSDGGSVDATCEIARETGAVIVAGPASRGGQIRRGAEAAGGTWLLFIHADTVLGEGWSAVAKEQMRGDAAGYGRLRFDVDGWCPRLVAGWANLRSRLFGLPYGDQGLLLSRALYDRVGGYADMPLMEDVEFARRLRGRLQPMPVIAQTSAARYQAQGWLRRGGRNLWQLTRYFCGADPALLARGYRREKQS